MPVSILPRNQPKIGGSFAGFVGLVVALIVVIIISSTAIYFLAREHNSHSGSSRTRQYPSTTEYTGGQTTEQPASSSWFRTLFSGNSGAGQHNRSINGSNNTGRTRRSSRHGHAWVQTGSGDEWDSGDDDYHGTSNPPIVAQKNTAYAPLDEPFRPPQLAHNAYQMSESTSSELFLQQYAESSSAPHASILPLAAPNQTTSVSVDISRSMDPPTKKTTADSETSNASSHFDPEDPVSPNGGGRRFTTNAGGSMRTRDGGTRFVEVL